MLLIISLFYKQLLVILFFIFLVAIAVALIIYDNWLSTDANGSDNFHRFIQRKSPKRGTYSEHKLVSELILMGFNPGAVFHDLYLRIPGGFYSQIDVVLATKVGLIVFEVKDYSGWIFGNANQEYWTQSLSYGYNKNKFYNPILQNKAHIENLKKCLFLQNKIPFYSIIVFYGDCEIKTDISAPEKTFIIFDEQIAETVNYILETGEKAKYPDKQLIIKILNDAVKNGEDPSIVKQHVQNIQMFLNQKIQKE